MSGATSSTPTTDCTAIMPGWLCAFIAVALCVSELMPYLSASAALSQSCYMGTCPSACAGVSCGSYGTCNIDAAGAAYCECQVCALQHLPFADPLTCSFVSLLFFCIRVQPVVWLLRDDLPVLLEHRCQFVLFGHVWERDTLSHSSGMPGSPADIVLLQAVLLQIFCVWFCFVLFCFVWGLAWFVDVSTGLAVCLIFSQPFCSCSVAIQMDLFQRTPPGIALPRSLVLLTCFYSSSCS